MIQIGKAVVHHGWGKDRLPSIAADSIDSVVCDPPYGLSKEPNMVEVLTHWLNGDDYSHDGGGFMGKSWDSFVPGPATWREVFRVLKPGGYALVFAGSRTVDLMAVSLRLAGFEIRDQIQWIYGSGFPKSLDISKALDKMAGAEREVVGSKLGLPGYSLKHSGAGGVLAGRADGSLDNSEGECRVTAPATDAARQWEGWGTALKPAHEPIIVARKPLIGTVAANIMQHGTGGLNIDGCRVETTDNLGGGAEKATTPEQKGNEGWTRPWMENSESRDAHAARVRANVEKAEALGRFPANIIHDGSDEVLACFPDATGQQGVTDKSAARFFYCAKASKSDRGEGNNHPTVKPQSLMRYLCRLVTPPGGTVLDSFAGSGSTGVAALAEGFRPILIEQDAEHVTTIKRRLADAQNIKIDADAPCVPPTHVEVTQMWGLESLGL